MLQDSGQAGDVLQRLSSAKPAQAAGAKNVPASPQAYLHALVPGRSPSAAHDTWVHAQALCLRRLTLQCPWDAGATGLLPSTLLGGKALQPVKTEPGKAAPGRGPSAQEHAFLAQALSSLLASHSILSLATIRHALS